MKHYLNSTFVFLVSFVYASVYWLGGNSLWLSLQEQKPFVYRMLVPFLASSLSKIPWMPSDVALVLVVAFSGVAFYYSLRRLYFHYYPYGNEGEIYIIIAVFVGMLVFGYERKPYDLMTAFLMTAGLYYMLTVQNWKYLIVFTLACFNRETTFLLILVYVVMLLYYRRYGVKLYWWVTACQIYIYGLVTYCIRIWFQYNPGSSLVVEPWQNFVRYYNHPVQILVCLGVLGVVMWRVFRNWNSKPFSLRLAFVVIAPLLLVMLIVCGQAFEFRVMWEVYPLLVLLI